MKRQSAFIIGILIVASCKAKTELNEVTNLNAFEKIAIQIKKSFHKYSLNDNGKNKIFLTIAHLMRNVNTTQLASQIGNKESIKSFSKMIDRELTDSNGVSLLLIGIKDMNFAESAEKPDIFNLAKNSFNPEFYPDRPFDTHRIYKLTDSRKKFPLQSNINFNSNLRKNRGTGASLISFFKSLSSNTSYAFKPNLSLSENQEATLLQLGPHEKLLLSELKSLEQKIASYLD